MPQTAPTPPATHQVEKIREIIVGRQFHAVEQRLARLEENLRPTPFADTPADPGIQREQALELQRLRQSIDAEKARQAEDTRRLAQQIQTIARGRREIAEEARRAMEADIRPWFHEWQGQLQQHLSRRESHLIAELRSELDQMRQWMREQIETAPNKDSDQLRTALEQFASAARSIAEHLPPSRTA